MILLDLLPKGGNRLRTRYERFHREYRFDFDSPRIRLWSRERFFRPLSGELVLEPCGT